MLLEWDDYISVNNGHSKYNVIQQSVPRITWRRCLATSPFQTATAYLFNSDRRAIGIRHLVGSSGLTHWTPDLFGSQTVYINPI